jgi:Uma2 family endonuclease
LVLDGVSWELYERLLKEIGDRPLRLTYDRGDLEIMSPLPEHEVIKTVLGRLIEALSEELDIPMSGYGSTTFRHEIQERGLEPDECFYFSNLGKVRGKRKLSPPRDPPPDLAVEVDISSRSVPRLPIYASLGVPEVWRFDRRTIQCLHLNREGEYLVKSRSKCFPMLRPSDLMRFVHTALKSNNQTSVIKSFRTWVRSKHWGEPA